MKTIAIINASGKGTRCGGDTPKQFRILNNNPVLYYSLETFEKNSNIDEIYVVCEKEYFEFVQKLCKENNITKFVYTIEGGTTANKSRYLGLVGIKDNSDDNIIIMHDAVRITTKDETITKLVNKVKENGQCVCGTTLNANIFRTYQDEVYFDDEIPSNNVFVCSMPFGCKYGILKTSFEEAIAEGNINLYAGPMGIVGMYSESDFFSKIELDYIETIKITYDSDFELISKLKNDR